MGSTRATDDDLRRSTLRHFVPGSLAFFVCYFLVARGLPHALGLVLMLTQVGALGVGYRLMLGATKGRLRRLSRIRALAAGFTAPMILAVGLMPLRWGKLVMPGDAFGLFADSAVVGLVAGGFMAATMFVRRRRPALPESSVVGELPGEPLEAWFDRVEREAEKEPWYRAAESRLKRIVRALRPAWAT